MFGVLRQLLLIASVKISFENIEGTFGFTQVIERLAVGTPDRSTVFSSE